MGCVAWPVTSCYIVTHLHFYRFDTGVDHPDLQTNKKCPNNCRLNVPPSLHFVYLLIKYTTCNSRKVNFVYKAMLWSIKLKVVGCEPDSSLSKPVFGAGYGPADFTPLKRKGGWGWGSSYCLARLELF